MPPTWVSEASAVLAARCRFPGGQERSGGTGNAGSARLAIAGNRRLRYPRGRRPTAVVWGGSSQPLAFFSKKMTRAGSPLLHLRVSAPSATFVSRARICKPFKEPSCPRINYQPGRPLRQPYFSYRPARQHRLAELIPRNRFLDSFNVYKYGLC